ncbi:GNAT family acetyltransferase [Aspergillus luchuensis]|uniref:GNAT family acetyltransferase n=1 Tax=Aspergillus kawachii TaxID=1069201 RepID=A0A146FAP2_ASPKA|nr:GNAT family acetyltransferase [Aspergillus luchuensis]
MTQSVAASSVGFPQSLFSDRHQGPGARGSKGRNALTWSMVLLPENVASQHGYKDVDLCGLDFPRRRRPSQCAGGGSNRQRERV